MDCRVKPGNDAENVEVGGGKPQAVGLLFIVRAFPYDSPQLA